MYIFHIRDLIITLLKTLHPNIQRWTSILANRLNARHRSNIRAPPPHAPSPQMYVSKVWESVWPEAGAGSDSQLAGVSRCHIFVPEPHAPPPKGIGQRSKVVILPTTANILFTV
jgi:hypothetical protein